MSGAISFHFLCDSGLYVKTTISAISLKFLCVSGSETHEKCIEYAPMPLLFYIKTGNIPYICVTECNDWCSFVGFVERLGLETHENSLDIAAIFVLCYININIGNVPNIYVTKYDDWCIFVAFFVLFRP